MIVEKIADLLGFIADYVKADYILYGAGGLTVLAFVIALLCGRFAVKFRKAADSAVSYLKSNTGTEQLDEKMEALPKSALAAWKNYKAAQNAAPAVYLTQGVCINAHGKRGTVRNYLFFTVAMSLIALFHNLIIFSGTAGGADALTLAGATIAPLGVIILGVIFAVILGAVRRAGYKKAVEAYNGLIACLNAYLPQSERGPVIALPLGATVHPETFQSREPEAKAADQPSEQPGKAYWEKNDSFIPPPSAAAAGYPDPKKEDVVAQIERITASGASKQTMLEVAKLLQAERAKAENKTPEQQKRLNAALATLLRAISAANA